MIELLLSVAMSSAVMLAAFSLVNAYAYASSEIQDLRPLRTEAVSVHAYVQNWMRRASDIIAVTAVADQLTVTEAGVKESGTAYIFAYMGERAGRAYDGLTALDEIEALVWRYNWDVAGAASGDSTVLNDLLDSWGACAGCPYDLDGNGVVDNDDLSAVLVSSGASDPAFAGTLSHYAYAVDNAALIADSDLNHDYLVANWFAGDPEVESWSANVTRFMAQLLAGGTSAAALEVKVTMLSMPAIRPDAGAPQGVYAPSSHVFQITAAPGHYSPGVGTE